jgi:Dolichyl-phosphate-mannose-protein mannosyltransferase
LPAHLNERETSLPESTGSVELQIALDYVRAVSAPDRVNRSTQRGLRIGTPRNAAGVSSEARARSGGASRLRIARWSAYAWGAIGATTAFVAVTCWWLTQDRGIPIYDAGTHLEVVLTYRQMLQAGNLLGPFTDSETVYPILAHMVGVLAVMTGGVSVASPIVGENLVFVPLLALGCYQTGRLLFGPLAGMLAVVFVLGSPLVISTFHVFLLDAPLTALVAVSSWLILASEDFSRSGVAGLAGLAVGLGMNIKVQFALFLFGLIVIVLLRGGWRNRRGFASFAVVALVIGLPWYIVHFGELGSMLELAGARGVAPADIPPTFSTANLGWYFWSVLDSQLLAPLFVLAVTGAVWTLATVVRSRDRRAARIEFLAAGLAAWLIITFVTPHHDIRYGLPLLAYLAVIGTGWMACVSRGYRLAGIAVLALGVSANMLGVDFGVGREVKVALARGPDQIVVYSPNGFLVSAPSRDGDVPGLLEALHREGVRTVQWSLEQSRGSDFSYAGVSPLARITGLTPVIYQRLEFSPSAKIATLIHESVTAGSFAPCTQLSDGTGVWVVRYDASAHREAFHCPDRRPQFEGRDAAG